MEQLKNGVQAMTDETPRTCLESTLSVAYLIDCCHQIPDGIPVESAGWKSPSVQSATSTMRAPSAILKMEYRRFLRRLVQIPCHDPAAGATALLYRLLNQINAHGSETLLSGRCRSSTFKRWSATANGQFQQLDKAAGSHPAPRRFKGSRLEV